jgi:hemerythrin
MSEQDLQTAAEADIAWNDSLSVSVRRIDNQHRQIMETISKLNHQLQQGPPELSLEVIDQLICIASPHIMAEEELMLRFHFPEYKDHHRRHNEFAAKLHELRKQAAADSLTREVPILLMDKLCSHIRDVDRRYATCFNNNRVR